MGKLTDEMITAIKVEYEKEKSYTKVAKELKLNWKTVKAHVGKNIGRGGADNQIRAISSISNAEEAINNSQDGLPVVIRNEQHSERGNQTPKKKSPFAKALWLFAKGRTPIQVAYILDLSYQEVEEYYTQYVKLCNGYRFYDLYLGQPEKIESILQLHDLMAEENMSAPDLINQLKYVGPIGEASKRYASQKERSQKADAEIADKVTKISRLESSEKELQARKTAIQKEVAKLDAKLKEVNFLHSDEKVRFEHLLGKIERAEKQLEGKESVLNELTSDNGSIKRQIRRLIEEKVYEILNDNEAVIATSIFASLFVIDQDAVRIIPYYFTNPGQLGESSEAFLQRFNSFLKQEYISIFNKFRTELTQRISNLSCFEQYRDYEQNGHSVAG